MSTNSGVNTGFAKCFILFMAVVILLEGCVYLGLAIWGITLENCSNETTDITAKPFEFAMDLIYFANENCGSNPSISIPSQDSVYQLGIDWAKSEIITNRMNIFLITYAAISALWIVTSLLVLATICGRVTKMVSGLCFWPWFIVVIAGSILDVVATGYHIHDIVHTTSADETFDYIGLTATELVVTYLKSFDAYFITPAVVMTCVSSRVVLIWLLNIFGTSFCLSLSHVLMKKDKVVPTSRTPTARQEERNEPVAAAPQRQQRQQSQQEPVQTQAEVIITEQYPPQIRPKPLQIQMQAGPPPPQRQSSQYNQPPPNARAYEPLQTPVVAIYPPTAPSPDYGSTNTARPSDITTYRNTDTHPDRLDYPSQSSSPEMRVTSPQLSAISPLNNRYSTAEGIPFQNPSQPQRVSDELRSQLPWSYTSMLGNKPQVPRKPQSQPPMRAYPEIPQPDYSMPGRKEQPITELNEPSQQSYSRW